ncbi:MAG TPA: tetratricopeptide repeat protein, partial [Bacteroidetes bacterium]|nr:tetratricopeptide repeat protein [Bacteroidota bacterium]
ENPDEAFSLNAFWAAQDSASSDSLKARAARDSTARDSTAANKEKTLASFSKQLLENEQRNTLGSLDPRRQRSNLRGRAGRNTQNLQRQKKKRQRKKVTVPKNPRQLSKKLIERANSLAELYLLQFELPDSALKIYEYLLDHFGDAPERPRWLFSMAYLKDQQGDTLAADSLYRELIADFPGTEYSNFARKRLGLSYRQKEKDPAEELFCRAEDFLFKKNEPDSALFYYRQVLEKFPKSDFAPKALYAIGWVYDWVLFDNQKAREAYEELKEKYPKSPYSKEASVKIAALEQAKKREEAAAKGAKDSAQTKAKPAPAEKPPASALPRGFVEQSRVRRTGEEPAADEGRPAVKKARKKKQAVPQDSTLNRKRKKFE